MDSIQQAIEKLSTEFENTKKQLALTEQQLAETKNELLEKTKQLEVLTKNPEVTFVETLNQYKEKMSNGIFSDSFDEFYRALDRTKKTAVEKVLNPIIFHTNELMSNGISYDKFHCFTNAIRLYDDETYPIKNWHYENPVIYIPQDMVGILGTYQNGTLSERQLKFIFVRLNCSTVELVFSNAYDTYRVKIIQNAFDDHVKLRKAFQLKQIADKHNQQLCGNYQKNHTIFMGLLEQSGIYQPSNQPSDQPSIQTTNNQTTNNQPSDQSSIQTTNNQTTTNPDQK